MSVNERTNILNVVFHPFIPLPSSLSLSLVVPEAMKGRARDQHVSTALVFSIGVILRNLIQFRR